MSLKSYILENINDFNSKVKSEEDLKVKVVLPYLKKLGYSEEDMNFESPMEVVIGSKRTTVFSDIEIILNGKVELNDAVTVLKAALGIVTLEGDAATAADVDKDGNINLTDALNVLKFALGIIKEFPQK